MSADPKAQASQETGPAVRGSVQRRCPAIYMISIASATDGKLGAILLEFTDTPSLLATRVDPDGEDVQIMGIGNYHDFEAMQKAGYQPNPEVRGRPEDEL